MKLDLLDFDLPEESIAQRPAERREAARLLEVGDADLIDRHVFDWPSLVAPGSLVVLNDTSVVRARLLGHKADTGGKVELLLIRRRDPSNDDLAKESERRGESAPGKSTTEHCEIWRAIGKGLGDLRGRALSFAGGALAGEVIDLSREADGSYDVRLRCASGSVDAAIAAHGHVPIPPYVRRVADLGDAERYQTVYARVPGAIAAPTAGLHLTTEILDELARREIRVARLTLHVGLGTFQPVAVRDLDDHPMHAEWMEVTDELAREIALARERGAKVVAVGTTVVRALEAAADPRRLGFVAPTSGETRILIQPGYEFRVVDAMLTNFHLPKSTLLALVGAFLGLSRTLEAYRTAIARGYRFYSYGDAMWIPTRGHRA